MNNQTYIEAECVVTGMETAEILIARLSEAGYTGFAGPDTIDSHISLKAYILQNAFDNSILNQLSKQLSFRYTINPIPAANWNKEWETSYEPVILDDFVAVRAEFHSPFPHVEHNIIIQPEMSFGTGHHATTKLMMKMMKGILFKEKRVLDFGTGTGILAILSEQLGAKEILAVDNDRNSIKNALENSKRNNCKKIRLIEDSVPPETGNFDIVLANLTRNLILELMTNFRQCVLPEGYLIVSGFTREDISFIENAAAQHSFHLKNKLHYDDWCCCLYVKKCPRN
ncbi:MAG: 50S ribosomal protein L11 methyltransferase [Chitinophagaceae bacterium]|nr:50S ribosomal protein L11 methyltransferase [Chitinophagaceae bacterium]